MSREEGGGGWKDIDQQGLGRTWFAVIKPTKWEKAYSNEGRAGGWPLRGDTPSLPMEDEGSLNLVILSSPSQIRGSSPLG